MSIDSIERKLSLKQIYFLLFSISFLLYFNTLTNQYAFDDAALITDNTYVQKGIAGFPEIFSNDMFGSYYASMGKQQNLTGGRYRPLSIATFAVEQQLFKDAAAPRHFMNVALYGICSILLFYFLKNSLRLSFPVSFVSTFLFLIHPVHTEVVANIKSRDEILCLIFYLLTLIYFIRFKEERVKKNLGYSLLFFFLGLLSKEYGITLLVLIPSIAFVAYKETFIRSLKTIILYAAVFLVYFLVRWWAVGLSFHEQKDPLNNPYIFATPVQKLATEFYVILKYFKLLVIPYPLSADYSYPTIAYRDFADPGVIFSIALLLSLLAITVHLFIKRHILSIAFIIGLTNLFMVSNLVIDIGATMGERFLFFPSVGFAMILGWVLAAEAPKLRSLNSQKILSPVMVMLFIAAAFIILPRNKEWYDTDTLFIADVEKVPESIMATSNAAVAYFHQVQSDANMPGRKEILLKGKELERTALKHYPGFTNAKLNMGLADFLLTNFDSAFYWWNLAWEEFPYHPQLIRYSSYCYDEGVKLGKISEFKMSAKLLEQAVRMNPASSKYWADLGGAYYMSGQLEKAKEAWTNTLNIEPANQLGLNGLNAVNHFLAVDSLPPVVLQQMKQQ